MQFSKSFLVTAFFGHTALAYTLQQTYDASNFFDDFSFYTGADPTHGDVDYVNQAAATSAGLISASNNQVYMGVDYTTLNPSSGRQSIRVSSNEAFTKGLFIIDLAHMPSATCGVWPAFWLVGPNWPNSGEIDIIEGVNLATTNTITLHTASGCDVSGTGAIPSSTLQSTDCNAGNAGTGCSYTTANTQGYGAGFNANGGGVYAMQWASDGIFVWFWPRGSIPSDVTNDVPNVGGWGTPVASFYGSGCDFPAFFANQNIVFDTTFCGDWAGAVWSDGACAGLASTCQAYVNGNPGAFVDAYWLVNSVKVYQ